METCDWRLRKQTYTQVYEQVYLGNHDWRLNEPCSRSISISISICSYKASLVGSLPSSSHSSSSYICPEWWKPLLESASASRTKIIVYRICIFLFVCLAGLQWLVSFVKTESQKSQKSTQKLQYILFYNKDRLMLLLLFSQYHSFQSNFPSSTKSWTRAATHTPVRSMLVRLMSSSVKWHGHCETRKKSSRSRNSRSWHWSDGCRRSSCRLT